MQKRSVILLLIFIGGLVPACGLGSLSNHDQDEAMLLMISSYTILLSDGETAALNLPGSGMVQSLRLQATATSAREVDTLINIYSDLYNANVEKAYELYPDRADQLVDRLEEQYQLKVDNLLEQKESLRAARRRRRWGLFRRIGRGLGRIARFIGRTVRTVVIDQARSLAENAIAEIKQRVRDVFEGRVNTLIAKVAGKFGPLAPFVQGKLKRVLDRWWIRLRDRVSGRLAQQQRGTQTAQAKATSRNLPSEDEAKPVPTYSEEEFDRLMGMDDCGEGSDWVDAYWENTVIPALKEEGKQCANTAAYYNCLMEKSGQGLCAEDAHEACEQVYQSLWAIPPSSITLDESAVTTPLKMMWSSFDFQMSFNGFGGAVNGSHQSVRVFDDDDPPCTVTSDLEFTGTFSPLTCRMQGTVTRTLSLSDPGPAGACWYHGCDFGSEGCTRQYQWALELKDGIFYCVPDLSDGYLCNLGIKIKSGD
jgi:hypothetical protein